ncbi:hypothetical protein G8S21_08545 [Clostridium botulinum C]|uniref:hypothetical protein n=1 Tax=Clostridium botulinum TaxID=1491 RepID=UPI001E389494|nr:hypothetical protein [Clostridium botulinum]MCD3245986.1 hypothetical protein [Clostridium botulinum C]MCD3262485.1 hypothetical protein [Clostridium botulinum C]
MKKICNYFILKVSSYKILVVVFIAFAVQFNIFRSLIRVNLPYNFYDLHMDSFDYLTIFYFISTSYLICIYDVCSVTNFYKYLFLKFKSRNHVFNTNVIILLIVSISYVLFINLLCVIESVGKIDFKNSWSPYFSNKIGMEPNMLFKATPVKILFNKISPLSYILYSNLFIILYLFILGLLFLVINTVLKKRTISLIMVIIIVCISRYNDLNHIIGKFTFNNNIHMLYSTQEQLKNNTFITSRLLYFGVLIVSLIVIGNILTKKLDYKFQGEK